MDRAAGKAMGRDRDRSHGIESTLAQEGEFQGPASHAL